jgi:hypothetical protein
LERALPAIAPPLINIQNELQPVAPMKSIRRVVLFLLFVALSFELSLYLATHRIYVPPLGPLPQLADQYFPGLRAPLLRTTAPPAPAPAATAASTATAARFHDVAVDCAMPATAPVELNEEQAIYQWRDASGQVHLSDHKPTGSTAKRVDLDMPRGFDYFALSVRPVGFRTEPLIRGSLDVGMTKIYHFLTQFLGKQQLRKVDANVEIHATPATYIAKRTTIAPGVPASTDGFYESRSNTAVVLYAGSDAATLRVAVHEATHIINAGVFGRTPRWFNEGMAEHFERMEVSSQSMLVPAAAEWLNVLARPGGRMPLAELLQSSDAGWSEAQQQRYYASSWALVHFLLEPPNQPVAGALFQELVRLPCDDFDAPGFFERQYPGGVAKLEEDYARWMSAGAFVPHTY